MKNELKNILKQKKTWKYEVPKLIEDSKNSIQRFVFTVIKTYIKKKFLRGDQDDSIERY